MEASLVQGIFCLSLGAMFGPIHVFTIKSFKCPPPPSCPLTPLHNGQIVSVIELDLMNSPDSVQHLGILANMDKKFKVFKICL